jgi:hypothetical protein
VERGLVRLRLQKCWEPGEIPIQTAFPNRLHFPSSSDDAALASEATAAAAAAVAAVAAAAAAAVACCRPIVLVPVQVTMTIDHSLSALPMLPPLPLRLHPLWLSVGERGVRQPSEHRPHFAPNLLVAAVVALLGLLVRPVDERRRRLVGRPFRIRSRLLGRVSSTLLRCAEYAFLCED